MGKLETAGQLTGFEVARDETKKRQAESEGTQDRMTGRRRLSETEKGEKEDKNRKEERTSLTERSTGQGEGLTGHLDEEGKERAMAAEMRVEAMETEEQRKENRREDEGEKGDGRERPASDGGKGKTTSSSTARGESKERITGKGGLSTGDAIGHQTGGGRKWIIGKQRRQNRRRTDG